jgi:riboflavin synthase
LSILQVAGAKCNGVFTGLIEEVGRVLSIGAEGRSTQLRLSAPKLAAIVAIGDSVAVNGCCLTVSAKANPQLTFDLVQGHIDCTTKVISFDCTGGDHRLEIELPAEFAHYAAAKGSIAINGVSLTVAELLPKSVVVWIISHTKQHTNIGDVEPGDLVNIEFDILAKYVERMLARQAPQD